MFHGTSDPPRITIRVEDHVRTCSTRQRGREFFESALASLRPGEDLLVSFQGIGVVTPSFLDETVVRLVEERPVWGGRLTVTGLSAFAADSLKRVAQIRGVEDRLAIAT
jgi:hypothetical protein